MIELITKSEGTNHYHHRKSSILCCSQRARRHHRACQPRTAGLDTTVLALNANQAAQRCKKCDIRLVTIDATDPKDCVQS
jgi:hypothetical protein